MFAWLHATYSCPSVRAKPVEARALAANSASTDSGKTGHVRLIHSTRSCGQLHARVLKKVYSTFRMRQSQKYTAVNKDGFEVGIIRREQTDDDPHPIKLSDADEDFWVAQARRASVLLDSPGFSAVIVATNGIMARMNTFFGVQTVDGGAARPRPLKRRREVLHADAVQVLLEQICHRFKSQIGSRAYCSRAGSH